MPEAIDHIESCPRESKLALRRPILPKSNLGK